MAARIALIVAAGLLAGCLYDLDAVPPPGGGADGGADAPFVITGVSPAMVSAGDTVVVEGRFDELPGLFLPAATGTVQPAVDVLGPRRLAITIPEGAISGPLELRFDGNSYPGPELRISSFAPTMGDLAITPRQFTTARQAASLITARRGAAVIAAGDWLYVLGGVAGAAGWLDDIERARIHADGTLGPFAAAGRLTGPRAFAAAVRIGDHLYLLGGTAGGFLDTIERATIDAGGLGPFEAAGTLAGARAAHRAVVIGDSVYLIGGENQDGPVASIERAPIGADGPGAFARVDGTALATMRSAFTEVVTRSQLVVSGGRDATILTLDLVESAAAAGDGSLAPFSIAAAIDVKDRSGHVGFTAGRRTYVIGGQGDDSVEVATLSAAGVVTDFTRDAATARIDRTDAGLAVVRDQVFVVGGRGAVDEATVEQASLARDAALGPFQAAGALTTPRARAGWVALPGRLCAVGGEGAGGPLGSIECAPVAADGTLGAFADAGVSLATARSGPVVAVIGRWLYVIGGGAFDNPKRSIERAAIRDDGTLGELAAAGSLQVDRLGATAVVLGSTLHVFGGWDGEQLDNTRESAPILADGSLGTFVVDGSSIPAIYLGAAGVVGPYVVLLGLDKTKRATIEGDDFGSFGDDDAIALDGEVAAAVAGDWLLVTGGAASPDKVFATRMSQGGVSSYTQVGTLVTPRRAAGAIVLGDWLYVLGGQNAAGTQVLSSIERARLQ